MEYVAIGMGVVAIVVVFWQMARRSKHSDQEDAITLPSHVVVKPQELLTAGELAFYNMIQLAVHDRYLVLAKVPLRAVLSLQVDGAVRLPLLRRMALKQLDFVLMHPGSRTIEQVIVVGDAHSDTEEHQVGQKETQEFLRAAGIRVTTLGRNRAYTVQELERMCGLGDDD
ncbi:hypothetical protein W02_26460 [Nitrospira sp. KM1]|uniref:DUF2726 domain-containing protein n=1 Tax=Nitrospira sp. KM1 TaxID=1936990 RepID=UPI0013A71FD5|nr:DUF2726 domain-containing protein [Nitrospira sp. KM1]BCA55506.1 hypothetical protein W02_26460 [Nitrospira sp. KM1]